MDDAHKLNSEAGPGELQPAVCRICGNQAEPVGERKGRIPPFKAFMIHHCESCRFSFVAEPRTDFENLYSQDYYNGRGADPIVNYVYDIENFQTTVKQYEWAALVDIYRRLEGEKPRPWLDFGCGLGGLVRYGRALGLDISGYDSSAEEGGGDEGGIIGRGQLAGRKWDFVSAVEVLEHAIEPLEMLEEIRSLMNPGGLLFITTGNAKPWRTKLLTWSYSSCPDVHVSFFEPETLALALEKTGFRAEYPGYLPGHTTLIKNKVLKTVGFKHKSPVFDLMPWPLMSRVVDARYQISALPIGVAV